MPESCSDGEPSAPLSGNPTQLAYLPPDRMTAFSRLSRFGMTFRPLTAVLGEAVLTSYLAAFPAKTSALPAKEQESPESEAECGDTWRGSLARFDPDSCGWKTVQHSLLEDSESSSVTWPRSGMTANGQCWELPTLEHRISGTGFGLWPTPVATDHLWNKSETLDAWQARAERKKAQGVNLQFALRHAVQKWPTPTVCGNYNRKGASATSGDGLATAVAAKNSRPLRGQILHFPTPSTLGINGGSHSRAAAVKRGQDMAEVNGGSLNPDWVEWLMNWPITWSGFNAVNRKEFQRWQEASAAALQESGQLRAMWWDRDPSQAPSGQRSDEQPEQELGGSLQQMPRITARQPKVEGSHEGSDLPLLRDSLHLQAGQGEDVQQGVREQAGLDEAQIIPRVATGVAARVDRLKAIGNGQVPLCAATAWKILTGGIVQ